ncbi:MAG: arylsulfatase [Cyclobacteriaceae bacterium]|nr:arylsulfatase [Cyclobacteriaceae bacterium]
MKYIHESFFLLIFVAFACQSAGTSNTADQKQPNVIYILADDLGYGDLGCYGQELIKTPRIDKMAREGMKFRQHYSGSAVCAPSRSSLMTGLHTGHTFIRGNKEIGEEGQQPLGDDVYTIAQLMKEAGYVTGAFGKWGLGMQNTTGSPLRKGFDEFFGYLCQRFAHRYYPEYLWHNDQKYPLKGNDWTNKVTYAPDVIHEKSLDFIRNNKDKPFFLYIPFVAPHAEIIAPDDAFLEMYQGQFEEMPWGMKNSETENASNDYGAENFYVAGYAPQSTPRSVFAAMISRLDAQVGEVLDLIKELGIDDNTLVIFTSDNGPHQAGGADPDFFNSNGPLKGYKRDLYEGGIRVPMIARWPGKIAEGSISQHPSVFYDLMPTLADITKYKLTRPVDGQSFLPSLLGHGNQNTHEYLYWEFHERGGRQALRQGDWKLVRYNVLTENFTTELYNLSKDIAEENNLAEEQPEKVAELLGLMKNARTPSEIFRFDPRF